MICCSIPTPWQVRSAATTAGRGDGMATFETLVARRSPSTAARSAHGVCSQGKAARRAGLKTTAAGRRFGADRSCSHTKGSHRRLPLSLLFQEIIRQILQHLKREGAGGEAWAPPPLPTPWAGRQGNPGSRGTMPKLVTRVIIPCLRGAVENQVSGAPSSPSSTATGKSPNNSAPGTRSRPSMHRSSKTSRQPLFAGSPNSVSPQSAASPP